MIEELYTVYFPQVTNYVVAMTKNREEGEDITQECFMRALANLPLLESLSEAQRRSWLYTTAKNIFIDRVRRNAKAKTKELLQEQLLQQDDLTSPQVEELLKTLSHEESDIFRLRHFGGYDSMEIGKLLSLPPGTVRWKLSSARKKLKQKIEKESR